MTRFVGLGAIGFALVAWFAAPGAAVTVTDTTVADFSAGTLGGCYVAQTVDGELLLSPTLATEFSGGPALPSGWQLFDWNPPTGANTTSVGGDALSVNSARVDPEPVASFGPGRSLEFVATFGAQMFQHVGFGAGNHNSPGEIFGSPTVPWAMFSTSGTTTDLFARVNDGTVQTDGSSVATIDLQPHRYRIDWQATEIDFFIDGASVAARPVAIGVDMRPAASDFQTDAPALAVDWIRMSPYGSLCTFTSAAIDGGNAAAHWTTVASVPLLFAPPTGVSFQTRTGNVPTPDDSWSAFQAVSGGAIASPNGQYLQYQATLSSTDANTTPELEEVDVSYDACVPTGPEICGNAVDEDCDGVAAACTPTETPTLTPIPPTATDTATATLPPTNTPTNVPTVTATATPVPPTPTRTPTVTPGLCGNGNVDPGEQCDDGNTVNGDCCSSTCHFEPAGSPCNDHNTCTTGEKCNGVGQCVGFTSCNTTSTCNICGSKCTLAGGVCKCG